MHDDAPARPIAILSGHVVPVAGPPSTATVLLRDGKIEAVGAEANAADDTQLIDATGMWVLPGFVEAHAHVGVHEESSGQSGNDTNEASAPNMAGIRALDGINIEDPGFGDAVLGGVTTVVVKPGSSNLFGGRAVAVKTAGGPTVDQRVLRADVSVKSAFGENPKTAHGASGRSPMTRMGVAHLIRQTLTEVRDRIERNEPQPDLHSETLARVLSGELVWDVHSHRHDDIATAMRVAEEFQLRLVINHGTEGYKLADEIAARQLPVVVGPIFSARSKVELAGHRTTTAAVLHEAGVTVALTTDHPEVPIHLLVTQAAFVMREGLPRDDALRAITVNPAAMYGLEDRVGTLTPGSDADVVVWSGDPFDSQSRVEWVIVDGRVVYSRSDQGNVGIEKGSSR